MNPYLVVFLLSWKMDSSRALLLLCGSQVRPTLMYAAPPGREHLIEAHFGLAPLPEEIPPYMPPPLHYIDDADNIEIQTPPIQQDPEIVVILDDDEDEP